MRLNRPMKVLVGLATLWPLIYMLLFVAFVIVAMIVGEASRGSARHAGFPFAAVLTFLAHLGTIVLIGLLQVFYVAYVVVSDRVPQQQKALWVAVVFLGNIMAMPFVFYQYVWPDEWPRVAATPSHDTA